MQQWSLDGSWTSNRVPWKNRWGSLSIYRLGKGVVSMGTSSFSDCTKVTV